MRGCANYSAFRLIKCENFKGRGNVLNGNKLVSVSPVNKLFASKTPIAPTDEHSIHRLKELVHMLPTLQLEPVVQGILVGLLDPSFTRLQKLVNPLVPLLAMEELQVILRR
jgi:hypothetical protein